MSKMISFCAAALFALGWSLPALAADGLKITEARARATPGGAATGVVYLTVVNDGATADRLIGGASDAADEVEIHRMSMNNGVMAMRPVTGGLDVPAHGALALAPGGDHLMLIGLKHPLVAGEHLAVTLDFEKAGKIAVSTPIIDPRAGQ